MYKLFVLSLSYSGEPRPLLVAASNDYGYAFTSAGACTIARDKKLCIERILANGIYLEIKSSALKDNHYPLFGPNAKKKIINFIDFIGGTECAEEAKVVTASDIELVISKLKESRAFNEDSATRIKINNFSKILELDKKNNNLIKSVRFGMEIRFYYDTKT